MQGVGEGRRFSAFNFSSFPGGDFGVQQRWNSREGGKGCAMLLASLSVCLVGLLKMNYFKSIFFFFFFALSFTKNGLPDFNLQRAFAEVH